MKWYATPALRRVKPHQPCPVTCASLPQPADPHNVAMAGPGLETVAMASAALLLACAPCDQHVIWCVLVR